MKLLIAGDYFVGEPNVITISEELKQLFYSCDYRIVNFEGPIKNADGMVPVLKSGPNLQQPSDSINLLKSLSVDAVTLANNHIMDFGNDGLNMTIEALRGFCVLGAGNWKTAYKLRIIDKCDLKVGLLNFCELQFGVLSDKWMQGPNSMGCAWINHPSVNELLVSSKKKVDYLIVIIHAGVEMLQLPLPEWRDRYREIIDCGCDAVIAHHPHVVQGYEIYNNKPIVYSLGNFCFPKKQQVKNMEWNMGAIAILDIQKDGLNYIHYGCELKFNVLSLVDADVWNEKMRVLCERLSSNSYIDDISKLCCNLLDKYYELFAMGGLFSPFRFRLKNIARVILHRYHKVHLLNNLQCESHNWCIRRALKCH